MIKYKGDDFKVVEGDSVAGGVIKKITDKTKGIVTVHYAGHPSNMEALNKIAKDHDLFLLEDAAHSMGASYNSQKVGNLGDAACFSFQALKNLTTGEGGMLLFKSKKKFELAKAWHDHGHENNPK